MPHSRPRQGAERETATMVKPLLVLIGTLGMLLGGGSAVAAGAEVTTTGGITISRGGHRFAIGGSLMWDMDYFDGLYNGSSSGQGKSASESEIRR